jgi:hypothetical protein
MLLTMFWVGLFFVMILAALTRRPGGSNPG